MAIGGSIGCGGQGIGEVPGIGNKGCTSPLGGNQPGNGCSGLKPVGAADAFHLQAQVLQLGLYFLGYCLCTTQEHGLSCPQADNLCQGYFRQLEGPGQEHGRLVSKGQGHPDQGIGV